MPQGGALVRLPRDEQDAIARAAGYTGIQAVADVVVDRMPARILAGFGGAG